jgi:hypothetical protein
MANSIVTVNVSQIVAGAPIGLQKIGALVTQGGTNTAAGTRTLLTQYSDLAALLPAAKALTSATWTGSVVTLTTTAPHGYTNGDVVTITVAGMTPAAYNGTFQGTVTGASTITYPLVSNPGVTTVVGTVNLGAVAQLQQMATTFFAQGSQLSVYVLELGEAPVASGISTLSTYIAANLLSIYRFLVPREWDNQASFLALALAYSGTTALTYFHVTTTTANAANYLATMKSVMTWVEAPLAGATEFGAAADFYVALNYTPSTTNKVTPNAFAFLFGVTAYPTAGNGATRTALKTANANIVGTGAEGGISNTIALWGTMADGHDLTYWHSVDWVQLHIAQDLANEIINGSNNPLAPLYYDQNGINRLQARAQQTANSGISNGLILGPAAVSAVDFVTYTTLNPADYPVGAYNGLALTYTPNRGFKSITFNVVVSNIPLA